jgi:hypothetical protein
MNSTPQKKQKQNGLSVGVPGTFFHPFKVLTKLDARKPSLIWTQWTWKPSPRSIGLDADENDQSRQVQDKTLIYPVVAHNIECDMVSD